MSKAIIFIVAALALPGVALAAPPSTHTNHSHAAPKVMYVLKGTFSAYTAPTAAGDGSITITISHANYHGRALKGSTMSFAVAANTRITYGNGTTSIGDGAKGMVKFRAPKKVSGDLATALPTMAKAFHVIVLKAAG